MIFLWTICWAIPIFVDYYAKKFGIRARTMVVSLRRGLRGPRPPFAQKLHMRLAIVDKRRQKANSCEVMNVIGDVRASTASSLDDMVDTAGSLCNAARAIVEVGGAGNVYACASHGLLDGPLSSAINVSPTGVALLNPLPTTFGEDSDKSSTVCSPMFAEAH